VLVDPIWDMLRLMLALSSVVLASFQRFSLAIQLRSLVIGREFAGNALLSASFE
jgi:hypothetical protein